MRSSALHAHLGLHRCGRVAKSLRHSCRAVIGTLLLCACVDPAPLSDLEHGRESAPADAVKAAGAAEWSTNDALVFCPYAPPLPYSTFAALPGIELAARSAPDEWLAVFSELPDRSLTAGDDYRVISASPELVTIARLDGEYVRSISLWYEQHRWVTHSLPSEHACAMRVGLDADYSYVDLYVDPAPLSDPLESSIDLLVIEPDCESESDLPSRLITDVIETGDAVVTYIIATRQPGARCRGLQATPLTIDLVAPLDQRRLLDGTHIPPSEIRAPDTEDLPGQFDRLHSETEQTHFGGPPSESGTLARVPVHLRPQQIQPGLWFTLDVPIDVKCGSPCRR